MDRVAWYNNLPTFRDSYQQGGMPHQAAMGYHQLPSLPMQLPYGKQTSLFSSGIDVSCLSQFESQS